MKRIFLALMGLVAMIGIGACSKSNDNPTPEGNVFHERDIIYIVNYGERQTIHISTSDELDSLLDSFCDHLESGHGHNITFFDAQYAAQGNGSKETSTITTADLDELKAWMRRMEDAGKTVNVTHDAVTGVYIGMAYANLRVTTPSPDWIDLGLPSGVLWASFNVGASCPEGFGDYFAWAETTPKPDYNWENYSYCHLINNNIVRLTKYCVYSSYGYNDYSDTLTVLQPCDDAATAYYGGDARTPTYYEWKELMDNCTFEWTNENDVYGYRITGPSGRSIFLPGADVRTMAEGHTVNDNGCYWSASLGLDMVCGTDHLTTYGWVFDFREGNTRVIRCMRDMGIPVRAVRSAR